MPSVASRRFVGVLERALASSGRITDADVKALKSERAGMTDAAEKAAADSLLGMLGHDRELDAFEVAPARRALAALVGVASGRLPTELERALTHAVPQANVTVKTYDLAFDFSKDGAAFPAHAAITLDGRAPAETILEVDPARLAIGKVVADGRAVPFEVVDGRLHVRAPGAKVLDVDYRVTPQDVHGKADTAYGLIRDRYSGRMWTLTWPYNTGALFPSNSAPSDGVTSRVTVKVAGRGEVIATGAQVGRDTFESKTDAPAYSIGLYTAKDGFESGPAGSAGGVAVTGYAVGNSVPAKVREAYRKTARDALEFYANWLGPFDYGKTLKIVETPGGLGGMEHLAAVAIMLSTAKDPDESKVTAAHETAHHWFGDNLRIASWGDFWMSEGFTEYATYRYFRHAEGDAKFFALLDASKGAVRDQLRKDPHALAMPADTDPNAIFDDVPYEMGAWMLRMIEAKLGTPAFDGLLRDWYRSHEQKAVSTADFVAFAKARAGTDLAPFFAAWNGITEVPRFEPTVSVRGTRVEASLAPKGSVPAGIAVPLRLEGEGGRSMTVMVEPGRPATVDAGFKVVATRWDPDRTVLAYVGR